MTYIQTLKDLAATFEGGEARFYVNDNGAAGPVLSGTIDYYPDSPGGDKTPVEGFVGLVDEEVGGMIAYGPSEIMESLADKLNQWDIVFKVMNS
jgi:hypothetical protein